MTNGKLNLFLHLLVQVLTQTAVIAIIPEPAKPYVTALVAVLGVTAAFFDTSVQPKI